PARDDLEVVRVVHHAEHVAERVDHRHRDEAVAVFGDRLVRGGAQGEQPVEGALQVVDVPVHDRTAGARGVPGRCVAAVDDPDLVPVVADAELDVRGRRRGGRVGEVRLDAEQLGVPVAGGGDVVGEEVQGGEAAEHRSSKLV